MLCVDIHTYIFACKKYENMDGKDTFQFQDGEFVQDERGMAWIETVCHQTLTVSCLSTIVQRKRDNIY